MGIQPEYLATLRLAKEFWLRPFPPVAASDLWSSYRALDAQPEPPVSTIDLARQTCLEGAFFPHKHER